MKTRLLISILSLGFATQAQADLGYILAPTFQEKKAVYVHPTYGRCAIADFNYHYPCRAMKIEIEDSNGSVMVTRTKGNGKFKVPKHGKVIKVDVVNPTYKVKNAEVTRDESEEAYLLVEIIPKSGRLKNLKKKKKR